MSRVLWVRCPFRACTISGTAAPARMAMMAMTMTASMRVKPWSCSAALFRGGIDPSDQGVDGKQDADGHEDDDTRKADEQDGFQQLEEALEPGLDLCVEVGGDLGQGDLEVARLLADGEHAHHQGGDVAHLGGHDA